MGFQFEEFPKNMLRPCCDSLGLRQCCYETKYKIQFRGKSHHSIVKIVIKTEMVVVYLRDQSLITGRGGLQNMRGGGKDLPLKKGGEGWTKF